MRSPHTETRDLKSAFLKHWQKISSNEILKKLFPNPPLLAYKRAQNLSDIVVISKLPAIELDECQKNAEELVNTSSSFQPSSKDPNEVKNNSNEIVLDMNDREMIDILEVLGNE